MISKSTKEFEYRLSITTLLFNILSRKTWSVIYDHVFLITIKMKFIINKVKTIWFLIVKLRGDIRNVKTMLKTLIKLKIFLLYIVRIQ